MGQIHHYLPNLLGAAILADLIRACHEGTVRYAIDELRRTLPALGDRSPRATPPPRPWSAPNGAR